MNNFSSLPMTTLFMVGDSTMCAFNDPYCYPRCGYGTQLPNYFSSRVTMRNLALSGRSSKSFAAEENYQTLLAEMTAGSYLLIGFGHNDRKIEDPNRFSDPRGSVETEGSFKYNLYHFYIRPALDAGVTPLLATPVVNANEEDDYTGMCGHITPYGNYPQAIRELGADLGLTVIDLNAMTKALYSSIGYKQAILFHAWTTSDPMSVDETHLNLYGAKNTAYLFASALAKTDHPLARYVLPDIAAPTLADRVPDPAYIETPYRAPDLSALRAPAFLAPHSAGWYGTAFGDLSGEPADESIGFRACDTEADGAVTFHVGQSASMLKGKIGAKKEGLAFAFRQVGASENFRLEADAVVTACAEVAEQGFGLMLRDDCYVNVAAGNPAIRSNSISAGFCCGAENTFIGWCRRDGVLTPCESVPGLYRKGASAHLSIVREGGTVTTSVTYNGKTYTHTYTDFNLTSIDRDYVYAGMYGTRGTLAEFTNVVFEITGSAR